MKYALVKQYKKGEEPIIVRELSPFEYKLVVSKSLTPKEQLTKSNLLTEMRDKKYWLLCLCKPYSPSGVKLITKSRTLLLSKIPNRALHSQSCPLWLAEQGQINVRKTSKSSQNFSFSKDAIASVGEREGSISGSSGVRIDSYYRMISTLLTNALVNKITKTENNAKQQRIFILKAAEQMELAGRKLNDIVFFDINKYYQTINALKEMTDSDFGENDHPQCLLMGHVQGAEKNEAGDFNLKLRNEKSITLKNNECKTTVINGYFSLSKGPLMAFILLSRKKGKTYVTPLRCFLAPALSYNSYLFVDSYYEKLFAFFMNKKLKSMPEAFSGELEKPLLPEVESGVLLLPDFVYRNKTVDKVVCIEIMGLTSDMSYVERKKAMKTFFISKYKNLIEIDAENLSKLSVNGKNKLNVEYGKICYQLVNDRRGISALLNKT